MIFIRRRFMKITRINENTISCIISPEDLRANGFRIDDFFEKKKEAVDFIRSTVLQAAISENFDLQGELTTMRVTVLPDHSLSLLITREDSKEGAINEVRRIAKNIFESIAAKAAEESAGNTREQDAQDSLIDSLLSSDDHPEKKEKNTGEIRENSAEKKPEAYMFSFYTIRDAMDCCRLFANAGPVSSSLYYLKEDDIYFLILRRTDRTPEGMERWILLANEFGELVTSRDQHISFVTEHGICIEKDNAIEVFMEVMPNGKIPKIRRKPSSESSPAKKAAFESAAPGTAAEGAAQ
jgi:negative regulator of genetic competence, sporulation and motility